MSLVFGFVTAQLEDSEGDVTSQLLSLVQRLNKNAEEKAFLSHWLLS
jgi:hypothetical protein